MNDNGRKWLIPIVCIAMITMTACGGKDNTENKVVPLPSTIDIDNLGDGQQASSFKPSDVSKNDDGTLTIKFDVCDYEHFAEADISKLKVGDTIELKVGDTIELLKKDVRINTFEDRGMGFEINGGYKKENGYTMASDGDGSYCSMGSDDSVDYYSVGTVTMKTDKNFKFVDHCAEPQSDGTVYDTDGFYQKVQSDQETYYPRDTFINISNGIIEDITRIYTP